MDVLTNVALGLSVALTPMNLLYCLVGVTLGTLIGVLPGLGAMTAMSMLFPVTFHLDPTGGLIMLAGIWYGSGYGGRTSAILLNLPGTSSSAVTCLDGHPMARQGRAGVALLMTAIASFVGGTLGIVLLMFLAPTIGQAALFFGPHEYFMLMAFGLIAASSIGGDALSKSLSMVTMGVLLGLVGTDVFTGMPRFTFGLLELFDGINLVALAMGLFGIPEVITSARSLSGRPTEPALLASARPTRDEARRSVFPIMRGAGIGAFFGTLPGTGPTIASFVAYAGERRIASEPERFGTGAIEGAVAPESAENSAEMTAFIPTLALGVPGSAAMALMLGALMIHGISPGPTLLSDQPALVWGLIMSFWIGNLLLLVINIPFIGLWVRILAVPYRFLFPAIIILILLGAYSISGSTFEVWCVIVAAALGYALRAFRFQVALLLLGFVLGPLLEENFRRAMVISRGDLMAFLERPISAAVLVLCLGFLGVGAWSARKARRRTAEA